MRLSQGSTHRSFVPSEIEQLSLPLSSTDALALCYRHTCKAHNSSCDSGETMSKSFPGICCQSKQTLKRLVLMVISLNASARDHDNCEMYYAHLKDLTTCRI